MRDFAVKAGNPFWDSVCAYIVQAVKMLPIQSPWGGLPKKHGLRSHDRRPCSMLLFDVVSAAERVEHFLEAPADTGENRRIAQCVA
jgi:hypothetical protein